MTRISWQPAPKPLLIADVRDKRGAAVDLTCLGVLYGWSAQCYEREGAAKSLTLVSGPLLTEQLAVWLSGL